MPLYESRVNAENKITLSQQSSTSILPSTPQVLAQIAAGLQAGKKIAIDGWYGVDWPALARGLTALAPKAAAHEARTLFLSPSEIAAYKKEFITDDPSFGYANLAAQMIDIMDKDKICALADTLKQPGAAFVYGSGAAVPALRDACDLVYYLDKTRQPLLWQMWSGQLVPFGSESPKADYAWKEYYYCDFYLLDNQKEQLLEEMDYYVEAINFDCLKLVPKVVYDEVIEQMIRIPVKAVKIFQPGPWGAYRYKDFWDVPGLECNAWNELAGPELSILIDFGGTEMLNIPFVSLMQKAEEFVGPYLNEHYPKLFPLDIWLDDGYFPKPEPAERISMPIHNHPSSYYAKKHFNEPIGRYETYYIAEAYEGANTWMGYREGMDLEEWERKCFASNNQTPIADWKDYMANWDSEVGDLYLIPPGTAHGHGGNQMVLEMDTCPSIAGTEYSFFQYDFARPSWDDEKKSMTGKPVKMHLEHGFDNEKWRRENWVKENLKVRPKVIRWTPEYYLDRYASLAEMPFDIERLHFDKRAEHDTAGRFAHLLTLTVGTNVLVRSKTNPALQTDIDLFQSCTVPASFGEYEVLNPDGGHSTVVVLHWKKG